MNVEMAHTPWGLNGTVYSAAMEAKVLLQQLQWAQQARSTVSWGFAAGDLVYGLCCPFPVKLQTPHCTVPASPQAPSSCLKKEQPHLKAGIKQTAFSPPAKEESYAVVKGMNKDPPKIGVPCTAGTTDSLAHAVHMLQRSEA